jgi:hypothetical protein
VILLNHVIQVLVGPDERLSGQYALDLQFGDGLMGRLTAVECDLLRGLIITDRFFEEVYGGRFVPIFTQIASRTSNCKTDCSAEFKSRDIFRKAMTRRTASLILSQSSASNPPLQGQRH